MTLTQFLAAEGVIDLAWGHPDPDLLPPDLIADACRSAMGRYGPDALAYGAAAGPPPLVDWLSGHLGLIDGRAAAPGELMITAGASQGLDLVCTMLTRPGDAVLVPVPTYYLAIRILGEHPLEVVPVATDEDGALPDAAARAADRLAAAGRRARLLYAVPTSGNPTGITLSVERRRALAAAMALRRVVIVEDDVYRELQYDGSAPPSIWSLGEPGSVVRLGSFSKTLAPGLRLGWLTADTTTVARLVDGGLVDSGGGVAHFAAVVVSELVANGGYEANLAALRAALGRRRDALASALRTAAPEVSFRVPGGGYFLWVRLPDGLGGRDLLRVAERHGVSWIPGDRFTAGTGESTDRVRLAFTRYAAPDLAEAARRLGAAVRERVGAG
jgi:DNA-binding transcriptional MocR family regulator